MTHEYHYAYGFGEPGSVDRRRRRYDRGPAIAYTEERDQRLCSSEAFYPLLTPHPDWAEESPLQILEAVQEVISKTAAQLRYKKQKNWQAIALSTVMHSFAGLG